MRKDVLFIYNLSAGKLTTGEIVPNAIKYLVQNNCRVVAYPILENLDAEEIIAGEKAKFDCVVCCGGDGTLSHTINGLMNINADFRPTLGYIPTGSTNDFAVSMGISQNIEENCKKIADGEPFYYDIGRFNNKYFNYVAAFGAFTRVSYTTDQEKKNFWGHSAYLFEALNHIPFGKTWKMQSITNGKTYEGEYLFCSVSDTSSIGGMNINAFENIRRDDGLFEVTLVKSPPNIIERRNLISGILIPGFNSPYIEIFKTDKIDFIFDNETPWTLDGEYGGSVKAANIKVLPKSIGLMR
jgi:diacylglycerol kinase (ATP)